VAAAAGRDFRTAMFDTAGTGLERMNRPTKAARCLRIARRCATGVDKPACATRLHKLGSQYPAAVEGQCRRWLITHDLVASFRKTRAPRLPLVYSYKIL